MSPMGDSTHVNTSWEELKSRGTAAFKNGEFSAAVRWYKEAAEGAKIAAADASPLHSNCSIALLRLAESSGLGKRTIHLAIEEAEKCIALRPEWYVCALRRSHLGHRPPVTFFNVKQLSSIVLCRVNHW